MSISFTITNDTVDETLSDLRRLFPSIVAAGPLPPMQEQPVREVAAPVTPAPKEAEVVQPKKTRGGKKDEASKTEEEALAKGEILLSIENKPPLSGAANVEKTPSASNAAETEASTTSASDAAPAVDIEDVRAKLKTLGSTDGLGHDKVFEVLGKYGAKNASTVPEDKRGELIVEIDALLEGAGK